jgi:hypothetical protein
MAWLKKIFQKRELQQPDLQGALNYGTLYGGYKNYHHFMATKPLLHLKN